MFAYIYGGDDQSFILQALYNFCVALGEVSCEIDTRPLVPLSNLEQSRRYGQINHILLCCSFNGNGVGQKSGFNALTPSNHLSQNLNLSILGLI